MSWGWLLVVLVAIPIYFVTFMFFELSALGRVAKSFLRAAQRKNIGKARKYLTEQSRAHLDERALEAFLSRSAISRFTEAKWQSKQIVNRRGDLRGILITANSQFMPARITFAKERGIWKIQSIHLENATLASPDIDFARSMGPYTNPMADINSAALGAGKLDDWQAAKEHFEKAIGLYEAGDFTGAAREYQATVLLEPACFPAYGRLGETLQNLGDMKGAIDAFHAVLRLQPGNVMAHTRLAGVYLKTGDLARAQASVAAAAQADPDFPGLHVVRGLMCHSERDLEGAIAAYRIAIRLDPNHCEAHYNLGVALVDQGDSRLAKDEFRLALRIHPNYLAAHGNLGNLLREDGDLDGAMAEYKAVLRLNPNEALAHHNLGVVLHQKGKLNEALAEYETALRLAPNSGMFHFAVGTALEDKRSFVQALERYRKAASLGEPQARQGIERIRQKISS